MDTATALAERLRAEIWELVFRQMRSLAGRDPELDDLVQAASERALRSLPRFSARCQLSTWTYRICYRTLLDERRWYRRWLRRFTFTADGLEPDTPDWHVCAADLLERRERIVRLRAALGRISPKRRTVVILHDIEGLDITEIAEVVDANLLTVRSRLRDGRKALLRVLENDPFFGYAATTENQA